MKIFNFFSKGAKDQKTDDSGSEKLVQKKEQKDEKTSSIEIEINNRKHQFIISQNHYILEQILDLGLDLPYSCQSGFCSSCRCKCIEGNIELEEADGLTESEKKDNYVLVCVGKAKSEKVKVIFQ